MTGPRGGVAYGELGKEEIFQFQENLLKTLFQLEDTFFDLGESCQKDCLIICDRGSMDPAAYMEATEWTRLLDNNGWHRVDIRDNRYHQVVHLTTAAIGAEEYYTRANNAARTETLDEARDLDDQTQTAWVGHPYFDVVGNEGGFDEKILKLIQVVCSRASVETGDRLNKGSRKRKWLVSVVDSVPFPPHQEFDVVYTYLEDGSHQEHCRIRKRGQHGKWSYTQTKHARVGEEWVETRRQLSKREYEDMEEFQDPGRVPILTKRKSFLWQNAYYQLDIYQEPLPPKS